MAKRTGNGNRITTRPRRRADAVRKKPPVSRRLPGRPPLLGPDQQARLIDAALACYVRSGIGATSIRDVAAQAGVTPPLVHYYFGDGQRLLDQVIELRLMPVFHQVRDAVLLADGHDPDAAVTSFVNALCRAVDAHPWWPALWVREVVCEGGALRELLVTRVAPALTQAVARRFELAQRQGRLNPDLDPRLIVVSLIGLTLFPAAGAPIWRRVFDAADLTMEDVRLHALALLGRGLEARS